MKAKERLEKINSSVEIEALPNSVTKYTAESIVDGFDIVVDALDSIDARYALNDACIKLNIPLIYAGALGMLGSICTIIPNKTACLRCIFPALAEDDMPTCSMKVFIHQFCILSEVSKFLRQSRSLWVKNQH